MSRRVPTIVPMRPMLKWWARSLIPTSFGGDTVWMSCICSAPEHLTGYR